ncbi:hypothetical protein WICPIJ_006565 [Wickerhamomyces pijperi]|uniref:Uncharacterized protein n=1 Tax=Wickerhamomyces pijperi TaxID=599730 RepID=A0A9P8Q1G5_WICPI|nr:hypothetical protein WICPIJ_006565 [Wickerhamomyces pijperi]
MSRTPLNQRYLVLLNKYPLLTKSITSAVLAILNEIIASLISGDLQSLDIKGLALKHPFSIKLPLLAIFASLIQTPINHYFFKLINSVFKGPLNLQKKIKQTLASMLLLSPIQASLISIFISLLNLKPSIDYVNLLSMGKGSNLQHHRFQETLRTAMTTKFPSIVKSSIISTPVVLTVCQKYLDPEYWVVFSSLVYFVLGTGQNTFVKMGIMKERQRQQLKKEIEEEVESDEVAHDDAL